MPQLATDDGVNLYYEEAGDGLPVVFVHEFAGDMRSWEPQMRFFCRRYRCINFNARGYPPSEVPETPDRYSQDRARDDILAMLDGLGIDKAHVVGLSMGGFATLHFGLAYPDRALSLVVAGCGYGAEADARERFQREVEATAEMIRSRTMAEAGKVYGVGPTRVQYQNKDPRGWQEFVDQLCEHSTLGAVNTMLGVQRQRPSIYDLEAGLKAMTVPTLIVNGDEDEPCLDVGLYMKRMIASAGLVMFPNTGHGMNLEEPALFNQAVADFFHQVESGRWQLRDPRSVGGGILSQERQ